MIKYKIGTLGKLKAARLFLFFLIYSSYAFAQITISGLVVDSVTSKSLPGVSVLTEAGVVQCNNYGFFSLKLVKKYSNVYVFKEGYSTSSLSLNIEQSKDTFLIIELSERILSEVTIIDSLNNGLISQINSSIISKEMLDKIPVLYGEKDIVRGIQILPGVITSGEAGSSFNVEGGGIDQNLFILDDITVYNVNHLLGFVSTFNPEIVDEATIYKGYFPAKFGGKLSSVIDIKMREGNKHKLSGGFALTPAAAKITFEGPIIKEKVTFLVSFRRTYWDPLAKTAFEDFSSYSNFYFHDFNLKTSLILNQSNRIFISGFSSSDKFYASSDKNNNLNWTNLGSSLRWNHIWNSKLFSNLTIVGNNYIFESTQISGSDKASYKSLINNYTAKTDFDYFLKNNSGFKVGGGIDLFTLEPGIYSETLHNVSVEKTYIYNPENYYFFGETYFPVYKQLKINTGIRFAAFNNDKVFTSIEPRIALDYDFINKSTISLTYSRTSQFLHLLTNTGIGLPTDLWVPSTSEFTPENAQTVKLSFLQSFPKLGLTLHSSIYYKEMNNIIAYKPGTRFLQLSGDLDKLYIPDWRNSAIHGKGTAYGFETMIEKPIGRLTASMSYTLSYAKRQFEEINFNEKYFAPFDRRHVSTLLLSYILKENFVTGKRLEVSIAFNYASANPVELPLGNSAFIPYNSFSNSNNSSGNIVVYPDYGTFRVRSNHHCDFAFRMITEKKRKRVFEFGVYNIYNRANPFYYYLSLNYVSPIATYAVNYKSYFRITPYIAYSINFK